MHPLFPNVKFECSRARESGAARTLKRQEEEIGKTTVRLTLDMADATRAFLFVRC